MWALNCGLRSAFGSDRVISERLCPTREEKFWGVWMPSAARDSGGDMSRFVKASDDALFDISEVNPEERYARGPYYCLSCSHVMVPALGTRRRHHFKHKAGRPINCTNESYFHLLAKMTLFASLKRALEGEEPFLIFREASGICSRHEKRFGVTCSRQRVLVSQDLAELYDSVRLEAGVEGFVADILLTSSKTGARLLVELAVTHGCEIQKIASGLPILEISIASEEEAACLFGQIDTRRPGVKMHNMSELTAVSHYCEESCAISGLALLLYRSGKPWFQEVDVANLSSLEKDPHLLAYELKDVGLGRRSYSIDTVRDRLLDFMIRQVRNHGREVRSCLVCCHRSERLSEHDIRCMVKERPVWLSSGAIGCASYAPESSLTVPPVDERTDWDDFF
jgi:hypothetical protein